MGVYIKNIKMPTDCGLCPFEDYGHCCVIYGRIRAGSGRDAACPLVEVPTPHGRLIDENEIVGVKWYTPEGQLYTTDGVGYEVDAPTVIEAEEWE